jgi:hypothetical protein
MRMFAETLKNPSPLGPGLATWDLSQMLTRAFLPCTCAQGLIWEMPA